MDPVPDASTPADADRDRRREGIKRKLLARAQPVSDASASDPQAAGATPAADTGRRAARAARRDEQSPSRRRERPSGRGASPQASSSLAARARRSARARGDAPDDESTAASASPSAATVEASPRPVRPAAAKSAAGPRERAGLLVAGLGKLCVQLFAFHRPATWTLYGLLSLVWLLLALLQPAAPAWAQAGPGAQIWQALSLESAALSPVLIGLIGLLGLCGLGALVGSIMDGLRRRPIDLDIDTILHDPSTVRLRIMRRRLGAEQEVKDILARAGFKRPQLKTVPEGIVGRARRGSVRALLRTLALLGLLAGLGLLLSYAGLFGNAQLAVGVGEPTPLTRPLPGTLRQLWIGEQAASLRALQRLVAHTGRALRAAEVPDADLAELEGSLRRLDSAQVQLARSLAERGAERMPVLARLLRHGPDSAGAEAELQLGLGRQLLTSARGTASSYRLLRGVKERLASSFLPPPDPAWLLGPHADGGTLSSAVPAQLHDHWLQALRQLDWWLARHRGGLEAFARELDSEGAPRVALVHVEGSYTRKASLDYPQEASPWAWQLAVERFQRVFSDSSAFRWSLQPAPASADFRPQAYRAQLAYLPAGASTGLPDTLQLSSRQFVVRDGWLFALEGLEPTVELVIDGVAQRVPTGLPLELPGLAGHFLVHASPWTEILGDEGPKVAMPAVHLLGARDAQGPIVVTPLSADVDVSVQGHEVRARPVFRALIRAVALPPLLWLVGCFGVGFLFLWLWSVSSSADLHFAVVREVGRAELCLLLEGDGGRAQGRALLNRIEDIARRP